MRRAVLILASLVLLASPPARGTDANLDPSFGSFGGTSLDSGPGFDTGDDVAIQPDGRIVAVGNGYTVSRFTTAGALDGTFGTGGTVTTSLGAQGAARAVALQTDGRIVVAGSAEGAPLDPTFVALRYDDDGTLDGSFGVGGIAKVDIDAGDAYETANAVAIQGDGRIVLAGMRYDGPPTILRIKVVRLLADGSLDASFGTGGIVSVALSGFSVAEAVALQGDGKIVVGGYTYVPYYSGVVQAFLVLRLESDGTLDAGFGTGGIRVDGPGAEGSRLGAALAIQPDGKILLGGHGGGRPTVVRYLTDGSLDAGFGTGGLAQTNYEDYDFAHIEDMVLRPDGKTVLVGGVRREGGLVSDTAVVRFNGDGSLDTTFTPSGRARLVIGARQSVALGAARQADGKIVVSGYRSDEAFLGSTSDAALVVARLGGSCGNAFLDPGEQCDDGNTDGLDCCSAGCGWDPPGQLCDTADASPCTYDTCDGAGACAVGGPWPASECLAVTQPGRSRLTIRDDPDDARDRIGWKWTKGPDLFYFGQPNLSTVYTLCVFGGSALASENPIAPGVGWFDTASGWKLTRDPLVTPGGIGRAFLKPGLPGRSRITLKGKGPLVGAASIPITTPVTAQLVSNVGGCFGATYATPSPNAAGRFKGKGE